MRTEQVIYYILVLAIVSAAASAHAAPLSLNLRTRVEVEGAWVSLGDLVERCPPEFSDIKLLPSPPWGGRLSYTRRDVKTRLKTLGIFGIGLRGREVEVIRIGHDRSGEVGDLLGETLRQQLQPEFTWKVSFPRRPLLLPPGKLTLALRPFPRRPGMVILAVSVQVNGRKVRDLSLPCRLARGALVPVALRTIARGDTIARDDIHWEMRYLTRDNEELLDTTVCWLGLRARRRITVGAVVTADKVEPRPVVQRGERVAIIVKREAVRVRARGEACQEGWLGSYIRVRNLVNNRYLRCRVVGKGEVSYD